MICYLPERPREPERSGRRRSGWITVSGLAGGASSGSAVKRETVGIVSAITTARSCMTLIEHRVEAAGQQFDYSGLTFTSRKSRPVSTENSSVSTGSARATARLPDRPGIAALAPHAHVGCGCFRAGRHFVDYLESGHYYGIDANDDIMQAGND